MVTQIYGTISSESMSMGDKHPAYVCDSKEQNCADRQKRCPGSSRAESPRENGLRQKVWLRRCVMLKRLSAYQTFLGSIALQVNRVLAARANLPVDRKDNGIVTNSAVTATNLHIL
jgi:hypothetical protein